MNEYDAFGRKKDDEAGLGDLGWGSSGDPDSAKNPDPAAPSAAETAAESGYSGPNEPLRSTITPMSTRTWRPGRNPIARLIRLAVLGAVAFGIYTAVDFGNDAANTIKDTFNTFDDFGNGSGGGGDQGDDNVPDQIEPRKLFTAAGLRSAVKAMEKKIPGRVETFALRRDRINATVIKGGKRAIVNFNADAEIPEVITSTSAGAVPNTLNYEQINPEAPFRLLKAANARVNKSDSDVDYFVVQNFSGEVQWGVYYKGGSPIAQGDSRGRFIRSF